MKIWHISDTHGYHEQLNIEDADMVVHSGDCCNDRDIKVNKQEWERFAEWFPNLPHKYKVLVFGNHDIFPFRNLKLMAEWSEKNKVYILYNSFLTLENGIKFFGSPFTPTYGNCCAFATARNKMVRHWDKIDEDTNIIVCHGPPKGILDLTIGKDHLFRQGGCSALAKKLNKLENVKACLFGHFHDEPDIQNQGIFLKNKVIYSNASCMKIGRKGEINSHGNVIFI